jgi:hypothetical protein
MRLLDHRPRTKRAHCRSATKRLRFSLGQHRDVAASPAVGRLPRQFVRVRAPQDDDAQARFAAERVRLGLELLWIAPFPDPFPD